MKTWVGKWINVVKLNDLWIGTSKCCEHKKKQSSRITSFTSQSYSNLCQIEEQTHNDKKQTHDKEGLLQKYR